MRSLLLSVTALISSLFLLLAGNSLQFVILGLRAEAEGFALTTVGAMTAGYYVGYAVGSLRAPAVVTAIGHIRTFAALSSVISGVVLAHALWVDPVFWVALRVVTGLCFAGLATVVESWLNARATREVRGRLLAIASIAAISGYAIGPLFTALGSVSGYLLFVVASILMSVALVPVTVTRAPVPVQPADGRPRADYSLRRLFRETPLGLVGCMAIGAVQGSILGLGAVFGGRIGLTDTQASLFVTGVLVMGMAAQYPLGWLSDRLDRRRVVAVAALVLGVGAVAVTALFAAVGPALPVIVLAAAVAGIAAMPLYPIVIAHVNDRLPESSIVPAAATLILSFSIGSALAGPVMSVAMDYAGPAALFGAIGVILIGFGLFTVYRMLRREAPAAVADDDTAVVAATPALLPMDLIETEQQLAFDFDDGEPVAGVP